MSHATLLMEIGMEECPARFIPSALRHFRQLVAEALDAHGLTPDDVQSMGTPRRLAVVARKVPDVQADTVERVKGPSAQVAFGDNGQPTRAAEGFARSQGTDVDQLVVEETPQGPYVFAVKRQSGRPAEELLPGILTKALQSLTFPKSMRWGSGDMRFARPIRWIVAMFGSAVLPVDVEGVSADRVTWGHRTLSDTPISLDEADDYIDALHRDGSVIVEDDRRYRLIDEQIRNVAAQIGGHVEPDEDLLGEVTHLVEWPTALYGHFDRDYLALPDEVLTTTMKAHQKYFPVVDENGHLLPVFITVRNGDDQAIDNVRIGNERVLAARLSDARFFFDEDQKTPLIDRVEALKDVLFQERLGSLWDKVERMRAIAARFSDHLDEADRRRLDRTIRLCKTDLLTQMVLEFPELQGVMGRVYARLSGEEAVVSEAIWEQYLPRHAGDILPSSQIGTLISIADKIDTIVGCFGVGLAPTGSADPYALRRQSLGLIRMMATTDVSIPLEKLIDVAIEQYGPILEDPEETKASVLRFFMTRVKNRFVENGYRSDVVDAVLGLHLSDVKEAESRVEALSQAVKNGLLADVLAGYERAANLSTGYRGGREVDPDLFSEDAERSLWEQTERVRRDLHTRIAQKEFAAAVETLASLKVSVDRFFDDVLVMAEDERVKENRLGLLRDVTDVFHALARFEHIRS